MKKLFQIVLVSSLSLLCFSCYYDEIQEDLENPLNQVPDLPDDPDDPDYVAILFQTEIQPIFDANTCDSCHNTNRAPNLRDGHSYDALVPEFVTAENADGSLLYTKLAVDGHRNLSTAELALIKAWINQGAHEN